MLTLPVVGGLCAISIEYSYLNAVQRELQGAADSAAHAASLELNWTDEGMVAAVDAAVVVAEGLRVNGSAYSLSPEDVHLGYYIDEDNLFVESDRASEVDAVLVTPTEESVGLGFGLAFLGHDYPVGVCAAVLAGPGNANTGDVGGPGLANGHFDVDTTVARYKCPGSSTCSGTTKHIHQYDDIYDVTVADEFDLQGGQLSIDGCVSSKGSATSCSTSGAVPVIADTQTFKLIIVNADLSPGAWLTINGVDVDVTDYDDTPFASLPTYTLGAVAGATTLTELVINFEVDSIASCKLIPTVTGDVKANTPGINGEWRSGALTIQAVLTSATSTAGKSAGDQDVVVNQDNGLLWESTYFWHWGGAAYTVKNAVLWQEDYDALLCHIPHFIDSTDPTGGGVCG